MLSICHDLIIKLGEWLMDKEKITLTMVSKLLDELKYKFTYNEKIRADKIINLSYFDCFECVEMTLILRIPKKLKYIYLDAETLFPHREILLENNFKEIHLTFGWEHAQSKIIPSKVTHLDLGGGFNSPIKNYIPSSVTHLTFGSYFNYPINDMMVTSLLESRIKYLAFGRYFNKPIKDCIPSSVIYLFFGDEFDQSIEDCIPDRVICLRFGKDFNQSIRGCIPSSVIYLEFGFYFDQSINDIPLSVTTICLHSNYSKYIDAAILPKIKFFND